ncbi:MAG: DUF5916 domain-containing protein, partial [Bacteroidota bacterium]
MIRSLFQMILYVLIALTLSYGAVIGQRINKATMGLSPESLTKDKPTIIARERTDPITIDGSLSEKDWTSVEAIPSFIQKDPNPGARPSLNTTTKFLYDEENLYVGVFCAIDSQGKKSIRTQNFRRDFDEFNNDVFGIAIDGFNSQRACQVFITTPDAVQRDAEVENGNQVNENWDAVWYVKTRILDEGWFAEFRIPWKTLRYSHTQQEIGIILFRNIRGKGYNEVITFPAIPRSFSYYRMDYAAKLRVDLPKPSLNMQFKPYILGKGVPREGNTNKFDYSPQIGGEIKWGISPNTVLDLTFNTDFAQADVDRQVQNLDRFSPFFPEIRPFFLENADMFAIGQPENIAPFFSRRIGLDETGRPIPVLGGMRLTSRTKERNFGFMSILQSPTDTSQITNFSVFRYSKNFGEQARIGGLFTSKIDMTQGSQMTTTTSADFFTRLREDLSVQGMVSLSRKDNISGIAATGNLKFEPNWVYLNYNFGLVDDKYQPESGFVNRRDHITNSISLYPVIRDTSWLPSFIRSFEPELIGRIVHSASTKQFQEAQFTFGPIWALLQDGSVFNIRATPTWQRLTKPFSPLGVQIAPGDYQYTRYLVRYTSDQSKKLYGSIYYEAGKFYNGRLQTGRAKLGYNPSPRLNLAISYETNQMKNVGVDMVTQRFHLFAPEVRLAVNPRLQLSAVYQYNSTT